MVIRREHNGKIYEDIVADIDVPESIANEQKIAELKHNLADTDYCIIKIAEGAATKEEYADVIASRAEWRKQINELEIVR